MIAPQQAFVTESGTDFVAESEIGVGGQGSAWRVRKVRTGEPAVLKLFDPDMLQTHPQIEGRTRTIVGLGLPRLSPALAAAPREIVTAPGFGYTADFISGVSLDEYVAKNLGDQVGLFALATGLAQVLDTLERQGIAHGDLSPRNVLVAEKPAGVPRAYLIDLDNARLPGPDGPPVIGTPLYMAPELYTGTMRPNLETDRFALGALLFEILLGRHPAAAWMRAGATTVSQGRVMARNDWVHPDEHASAGGYPSATLPAKLRRMLRRALSTDPSARPRACEWRAALRRALDDLWECPSCQIVCVNDDDREGCPACGAQAVERVLRLAGGGKVVLRRPSVRLGRHALGGASDLSHRHAVFQWEGFELVLRDESRHGTYLARGKTWVRLPEREPVEVREGDRLRFGRATEAVVE